MQLTLTISSQKEIALPIASNAVVQGLIYNALRSDSCFSYSLHETGTVSSGRNYKLFNFSEIKGRYRVENKMIFYTSPISITIRSCEAYFIQLLLAFFTSGKKLMLHSNEVTVEDIKLSDRMIYDERIIVKTLSPITTYITDDSGHTLYYSPEDKEFCDHVVRNARRKFAGFFGNEEGFALVITPCGHKPYIKRATRFKDTFVTAWHGEFELTGSIKTLNFLYSTGLGSKNSQGFGMFELVKSNDKVNKK